MNADRLPTVLTFPGTKQNSISVLRALKNIRDELVAFNGYDDPENGARFQVAVDDLDLLIGTCHD